MRWLFWACVAIGLFEAEAACAQAFQAEGNLLVDGSFEDKRWCPTTYNNQNLKTLNEWSQPTGGTPDHFDVCAVTGSRVDMFGDIKPVDGTGYTGVVLHSKSKPHYREYLSTKLTRDLAAGEWVCVSWWVMSSDIGRLVSDRMGVALTEKQPKDRGEGVLADVVPAVENPALHMLSNRHSWVKLNDAYQANGGERWLTIGSFATRGETRVLERPDDTGKSGTWSFVFIDAVEVRPVPDRSACECLNATYAAEVTDPPWQVFLKERVELSSVLFAFDSHSLDAIATEQLEDIAATMRSNRFLVMEVNGHTDIVGPDGYNLVLSERRAQAVMDFLVRQGVDPNRLKLAYHGSRLPTADNTTADGRRQNRRVEFELLEHAFLPMD